MGTLGLILMVLYTTLFARESDDALDFIRSHAAEIRKETPALTPDERLAAMAIVAPELSQYSTVTDFFELRALFITYRNFGRGNFSVGYFQMKPSFIEEMERQVRANASLKKRYASYLPKGDEKKQRETRLERLSTLQWQLRYLQLFIELAKIKTAGMHFKTPEEMVRYWATLYNSGLNLSPAKVAEMQKKRLFPSRNSQFNYSDVALEFYQALKKMRIFT